MILANLIRIKWILTGWPMGNLRSNEFAIFVFNVKVRLHCNVPFYSKYIFE